MNLKLENIGLIKEANLKLDGITVIAAENDSGKSTIGKALFSLVFATNNFKERFIEALDKRLKRYTLPFNFFGEGKKKEKLENIRMNLLKKIKEDLENDSIIFSNYEEIFLELEAFLQKIEKTSNKSELYRDFFGNYKIEEFERILNYNQIIKTSFQEIFEEEFETTVSNIFSKDKNSKIILKDRGINYIDVSFINDTVDSSNISPEYNYKKYNTVYIETPVIMDYINDINFKSDSIETIFSNRNRNINSRLNVFKSYITIKKKRDMIDNILKKREIYNDFLEKIRKEISGDLEYDKNKDKIIYKKNGYEINLKNVATGIKAFGILEMLLKNERLDENLILIIDEPEVHLHPKWQIKYAEYLIMLSKELGVKILLNSHSPYFIRALEVYGEKYEYEKSINFYTMYDLDEENSKEVRDVTNDLNEIFDRLIEPYEILKKVSDLKKESDI